MSSDVVSILVLAHGITKELELHRIDTDCPALILDSASASVCLPDTSCLIPAIARRPADSLPVRRYRPCTAQRLFPCASSDQIRSDVCKQRRQRGPPCGAPSSVWMTRPFLHDAALQIPLMSSVTRLSWTCLRTRFTPAVVMECIEILGQVDFRYTGVSLVRFLLYSRHGLLAVPFRSVSIAFICKDGLKDGDEFANDCLLDDSVDDPLESPVCARRFHLVSESWRVVLDWG